MIIGHEKNIALLENLAASNGLTHGYLFFGAQGVGKHTVAKSFAERLETGASPYTRTTALLGDCLSIHADQTESIGIAAVREIKEFLRQRPNRSHYRTVIIAQGECLTPEAQHALLKITEDPPSSALIFLIAKNLEVLRATLVSRFQKLYFATIPEDAIAAWLVTTGRCSAKEARLYARKSFGAPGRAHALSTDAAFQRFETSAGKFLDLPRSTAPTFLKNLLARDDFRFNDFLDAVIVHAYLAYRNDKETRRDASHKRKISILKHALTLRRHAAFFNLNPRLQLQALLE